MGGRGASSNSKLDDAIKSYTAKGGQMSSQFPMTDDKFNTLKNYVDKNNYTTTTDIYRKVDLSESSYNDLFNRLYNNGEIDVPLNGLNSFTKQRERANSYGGTQPEYVIYKIPKGTTIKGADISQRSIYPEEKEVLLGKNKFKAKYNDISWTSSDRMIITLRK